MIALYQSRVARLASRLLGWRADVEDVVQDVFLAAMTKAHRFRQDASVWTWLTAITLNRCRSQHRRAVLFEKFRRSRSGNLESPSSDHAMQRQETAASVRKLAVAALRMKDRELIVLFYLEERPTSEIAALLGASLNAIEVRLHRARRRLKTQLAELDLEECYEWIGHSSRCFARRMNPLSRHRSPSHRRSRKNAGGRRRSQVIAAAAGMGLGLVIVWGCSF